MIYLIKSAGYDENENLIHLLKIGYTEDNNRDRRFMSYKLHNPTCKILYEIPSLSEDIEKRIQYKFRDYKYKEYGNEWFYYNDDVINFFRDIDKVDLESLPKNPVRGSKEFKKIKNECREVLSYFFNSKDTEDYLKNIISKVKDQLTRDYVLEYLRDDSSIGPEGVDRYLNYLKCLETGIYCEDDIVNREVSEFLKVYIGLNTIHDKLKMLCEYGLSSDAIDIVLGQIADSDEIKSYYTTLGSSKLKSLSYNSAKIKNHLGVVTFSQELLESSIYSEFKVGDKITLSDIKSRLEVLYKSINYDKVAKAKDLENYFEVKNSSIYENGKKVKCYIIIKKKG
jgi:hypothetical protein